MTPTIMLDNAAMLKLITSHCGHDVEGSAFYVKMAHEVAPRLFPKIDQVIVIENINYKRPQAYILTFRNDEDWMAFKLTHL